MHSVSMNYVIYLRLTQIGVLLYTRCCAEAELKLVL